MQLHDIADNPQCWGDSRKQQHLCHDDVCMCLDGEHDSELDHADEHRRNGIRRGVLQLHGEHRVHSEDGDHNRRESDAHGDPGGYRHVDRAERPNGATELPRLRRRWPMMAN
jgi:hypothetical protein